MSAGEQRVDGAREARMLDADIAHAFDAAQTPVAHDADALERVRQQVWQTLSLSPIKPALTTRHAAAKWRPFLPGVTVRVLANEGGIATYLLRLQANAALPPHPHEIDEECYVLEGDLEIEGELTLGAGDFHLARAGRAHPPIRSYGGATILLRGASPF